jgi:carbamoyltransferase
MHILGISCFYHDAAAALITDGVVVAAAEEERFSRKKHDNGYPELAIEFCLKQGGITAQDLDFVVFYEKPLTKFERILLTTLGAYPRSWQSFGEAMITWFDEKLWVKDVLRSRLGVTQEKVLFTDHHMSHASSAFFCSPFKEAAILTVDGVGEWTTTAFGRATADWDGTGTNEIRLEREIRFPHSLGLLYSAFTAWLGFEVNEGEYKVMGMAPYGEPKYLDKVYQLIEVADDGSFWMNMDYFSYHYSPEQTFSRRFVQLFGEPRHPESEFITRTTHPGTSEDSALLDRNQYYADVAASIQRATEEILLKMARHLQRETGLKNLCIAGGVALNSVANGRILLETDFEDVFIQPAAGDAGGALGAALYVYHVLLGKQRRYVMEDAYLGKAHDAGEIRAFLERLGVKYEEYNDEARLTERLVDDLTNGEVLGWFQGRFEWGPRALGNRSIIADPRRNEMKEIVNTKIKFREPFRPFAPVVPESYAQHCFRSFPDPQRHYPARYMLMVLPWETGPGSTAPAVNHMGTGRLQTVRREWNHRYYDLVDKFGQATGVPVLMNTSFNLRGEPMVSTPENAWNTFSNSGIDALVLSNFVVRK